MGYVFFFFNDTATTEIYTLSLHDALPIWSGRGIRRAHLASMSARQVMYPPNSSSAPSPLNATVVLDLHRSEEHTSELQSQSNLVCRLLLENNNIYLLQGDHDPAGANHVLG